MLAGPLRPPSRELLVPSTDIDPPGTSGSITYTVYAAEIRSVYAANINSIELYA
jgi:hypothetical protein